MKDIIHFHFNWSNGILLLANYHLVECVQTRHTLCKFFIETMINLQAGSHVILPLQHELVSLWFMAVNYKIVTVT